MYLGSACAGQCVWGEGPGDTEEYGVRPGGKFRESLGQEGGNRSASRFRSAAANFHQGLVVNLSSDRPCEPNPLSSAQSIIERHAQSMAEDESVDMNAFEESALSHNTLCWEDE